MASPSCLPPERRDAGIKPLVPLLLSPSFQRKGVKGGEMECVIERYKVPEEKKWTGSLMRTLALMQMGIDYHCRSVRRYLTLTGEECVCVCLHVRGHGCVFILRSIRCLFHLLHLSLYEQSLIILLSALMEFFGVFFPTYTYFFFLKFFPHREPHQWKNGMAVCTLYLCEASRV